MAKPVLAEKIEPATFWLAVIRFVPKVNLGVPVSAEPTEPPAATEILPLASKVVVAEGVCTNWVPPPVIKAVEVKLPAPTTATVPAPDGTVHEGAPPPVGSCSHAVDPELFPGNSDHAVQAEAA